MGNTPLDKPASSSWLHMLAKENQLTPQALERAMSLSGILPTKDSWKQFFNNLFLLLGTALLLAGIIFFFAYNWASMQKFGKLGIIQLAILAMIVLAWYKGADLPGKCALLAAAVLVGPYLAVYGQIYQTGADAYELFIGWAALIAGWVFISKFQALWFFWLVVINTGYILYCTQVYAHERFAFFVFQVLFILDVIPMVLWEFFSTRSIEWLKGKWLPRIIFLALLHWMIIPVLYVIFEHNRFDGAESTKAFISCAIYASVTALVFWYYQFKNKDLFLLTLNCLGLIIVVTCGISKMFNFRDLNAFILLSILVVVQAGAAGTWLRKVWRSWTIN